jgi:hypothetical protein
MKLNFIYPILLISLLVLLFLGLGEHILYAKSGIGRILPVVLIFGGIPFTIYKTLLFFLDKKNATKYAALSILILGPGFGIWSKYLSENDFKNYGKVTYGKVIERDWTSVNNRGRWTITAEFEFNSKKYLTFSKDDNDNKFRLNDKIRIRFSTRNPENNEIIDLK